MTVRIDGVVVQRTPEVGRDLLRRLREPALEEWLCRLNELDALRRTAADDVSDAAEVLIGGEENKRLRRALINMRRAVHNDQRTRALKEYQRIEQEHRRVDGFDIWSETCRRLDEHVAAVQSLVDGVMERSADAILSEAMTPGIGTTIVASSGPLGHALLHGDALRPKDRDSALRSLGEYVLRSATRTTPFGGFTRVGLLSPAALGDGAFVEGGDEAARTPRLNVEVLAALRALVLDDPSARRELTVRLTDGIAFENGRIRYIRRKAGRIHESGRVTQRSEDVFFLSNDSLLEVVFSCFARSEEWKLGDLITEAAERLRALASQDEIEDAVVELLRQAFVVAPVFEFSILEVDPLGHLINALSSATDPAAQDLRGALVQVRDLVAELAECDARTAEQVLGHVADVLEGVGLPAENQPSPLVYLDTIDARSGRYSPTALNLLAGKQLEDVRGILPLFDRILPDRLLLQGFLRARHGRDTVVEDVLKVSQEFNEDLYDVYRERVDGSPQVDADGRPVPVMNWLGLEEVDRLNCERAALIAAFDRRYQEWAEHRTGVLELDEDFFTECRSTVIADVSTRSTTVTVQPVQSSEGSTSLVVNGFYAGMGLMASRFLHAADDSSPVLDAVRGAIAEQGAEDILYAEISGGHDSTNLNLHRQTLDWQIICPGEGMRGDPAHAIPLDSLSVVWRDGTAVLWSTEHGRRVIPVYQGFLMPFALPALQRVLILFSPMNVPVMDLWSGVDPPLGDKDISDHPRVCYGPLVLVRHVWKMRPDYVPSAQDHDVRAAWIAELERWRVSNGLPRTVYATADTPPLAPTAPPGRTKPQFVDFRSPWTLEVLDRLAREAHSRLVLVEALPDPSEVAVDTAFGTDRNTELVMEVVS